MPLIAAELKTEKEELRIKIPSKTCAEVQSYCRWAGIQDMGHFFAKAAELVFLKDRAWKKEKPATTEVQQVVKGS